MGLSLKSISESSTVSLREDSNSYSLQMKLLLMLRHPSSGKQVAMTGSFSISFSARLRVYKLGMMGTCSSFTLFLDRLSSSRLVRVIRKPVFAMWL